MNEFDEVKLLRLQEELRYMDQSFIEQISTTLLNELADWTNIQIFTPKGGEVKLEIPAFGAPNARAITPLERPLHPTIEIRLSMLIDIYRDALTFPLIAKRLEEETETIKNINNSDERFREQYFTFESGIPPIPRQHIDGPLAEYCEAMAHAVEEKKDPRIGRNEVYCRFLMFEFMLTWTYFHELSHILQRHYLLKFEKCGEDEKSAHIEEIYNQDKKSPDLPGQALELLADLEAIDLTLKYLERTKRITYTSFYLLLCSVGCMFQRFYKNYDENLNFTNGQHPHPAIRDEEASMFCLKWIKHHLVTKNHDADPQELILPLIYSSVRSSLITGLFRAHRIEKHDGSQLPSYLRLFTEEHQHQKGEYRKELHSAMRAHSKNIREFHLLSQASFDSIFSLALG